MGVPQAQFWEMWVPKSNFLFNFASFWVSEQNFRVSETPGQPLRTALMVELEGMILSNKYFMYF